MSLLPTQSLESFRQLHSHLFGGELSESECAHRARRLIELYRVIYHPGAVNMAPGLREEAGGPTIQPEPNERK